MSWSWSSGLFSSASFHFGRTNKTAQGHCVEREWMHKYWVKCTRTKLLLLQLHTPDHKVRVNRHSGSKQWLHIPRLREDQCHLYVINSTRAIEEQMATDDPDHADGPVNENGTQHGIYIERNWLNDKKKKNHLIPCMHCIESVPRSCVVMIFELLLTQNDDKNRDTNDCLVCLALSSPAFRLVFGDCSNSSSDEVRLISFSLLKISEIAMKMIFVIRTHLSKEKSQWVTTIIRSELGLRLTKIYKQWVLWRNHRSK